MKNEADRTPRKTRHRMIWECVVGIGFLCPNMLGFVVFTFLPLIYSLVLAFSNWDLRYHNIFHPDNKIEFIGFTNFERLINDSDFWRYLGNTLFMITAVPVGIALSLFSALLLNQELRKQNSRVRFGMVVTSLSATVVVTVLIYFGELHGMAALLLGLTASILSVGVVLGATAYRTLFYLPNFTAGVATMLLWKKILQPRDGVLNILLAGPLRETTAVVRAIPQTYVELCFWSLLIIIVWIVGFSIGRFIRAWLDSDIGNTALGIACFVVLLTPMSSKLWLTTGAAALVTAGSLAVIVLQIPRMFGQRAWGNPRQMLGIAGVASKAILVMLASLVLTGLAVWIRSLPAAANAPEGLEPPAWLQSATWVKPGLMIMGLWSAIGSGNMLLYLAALNNVPPELYEAADIDGAGRIARFCNVTWPQLAPTTFFIVVMSVIGGLQGGFDQAKVMTNGGGPAGASTTMSYMIYEEGFQTGRLGFSAGASWTLFLMVLLVTAFNWRVGTQFVND